MSRNIRDAAKSSWCEHKHHNLNQIKGARAPLMRVAEDIDRLVASLRRLPPASRMLLEIGLSLESSAEMNLDWFEPHANEMVHEFLLRHLALVCRRAALPRRRLVRHRPSGSTNNPALWKLVLGLYGAIEGAGGVLTLRKDVYGRTGGTLPTVLEILRPHMAGIIPLPYETLREIRKRVRAPLGDQMLIPNVTRFIGLV
jgi:hypothetical protein